MASSPFHILHLLECFRALEGKANQISSVVPSSQQLWCIDKRPGMKGKFTQGLVPLCHRVADLDMPTLERHNMEKMTTALPTQERGPK